MNERTLAISAQRPLSRTDAGTPAGVVSRSCCRAEEMPTPRARRRRAPEKAVQARIVNALRTLGFDVTSTSQPQRAMMTPGIPDLYCRHPGWRIRFWVECKAPGGRLSLAQRIWHEQEHHAGGVVIVARSVADVLEAIKAAWPQVAGRWR